MFETDRLILRGFRESDVEVLLKLFNDPATQRYLWPDYLSPRGEKFVKDVLKPGMEKATLYVIITSKDKDGEAMGYAALTVNTPKNRDGHLEIGLLPEWQGKGYGTEALRFVVDHGFREFQLHRASLGVLEGNVAARAMYTKLGFREEGRKRQKNWVNGHWEDAIMMGMIDHEWAEWDQLRQQGN
ncbi:acyl-CoA N-acyltransferase [Neolentinus lepideus HHB14362 ss-1]|uniref:Acyl-CoA N-acyltransferase n=1 Tax=Neolentinus lepideus HHB14362 ss-1 TaxID=1314782 RepID=A0A165NDU6_9AGAM|nr:acyl-CoA N-acyltransferase [Neolentinus lepideus HHB14362 ss-1]